MIGFLLQKYLSGFSATTILDLGPGYSDFARIAAATTGASSIVYSDCDREVLRWQAIESEGGPWSVRCLKMFLDPKELAQLPGPYDLILCQEVLEHLIEAEDVLKRLSKVLSPQGRVVITVPTKFSERWLKWINPSYMNHEPYGHVREFDKHDLENLLEGANLYPLVLIPTQPHYFLSHTWLFGTRMQVDGATGKVLTTGFRTVVWQHLTNFSRKLFMLSGHEWWGRRLPRNYFIVAGKCNESSS